MSTESNRMEGNNANTVLANRYFFVSTIGQFNGNVSFNNFEIRQPLFPSLKQCIEETKKRNPDQQNIMLLGLSEISKSDWDVFVL